MVQPFFQIFRSLIPRNSFVRNSSLLVGGTLTAQILLVAASPILTRLYSPSDFGLLGVYTSMLAITLLLSSLRFDIAIPLPEEDVEAANLVALSLIIVVLVSLIILVFILVFRNIIAQILGLPLLTGYLFLLPLGTLIGGAYNVLSAGLCEQKNFG